MLSEDGIINALSPLLQDYAQNRVNDEYFGDFVIRKGYIKATLEGKNFHK
jgi:sulfite reductase (NADPH) hemoprotein beta-component